MRILIINDFYTQGGAETQVDDEIATLQNKGIEVFSLSFDPKYNTGFIAFNRYNYKRSNKLAGKFFNKFFINYSVYKKIINALPKDVFDYIHIHNSLKMTKTVNHFVKKQNAKVIKTFHDYGYICPKGTSVKDDGKECKGFACESCSACSINPLKKIVKRYELKKNQKWINKNVYYGLCPSINLKDKMLENNYHIKLEAFPNVFNGKLNKVEEKKNKDFLYCGVISKNKGIDMLLSYFSNHPEYNLTMVGKPEDDYKEIFENKLKDLSNVNYLGRVDHDKMFDLYSSHYVLIVPSLWLENYPNVVLESIFSSTLCIGANRGGIPEMIGNKKLLFDPLSLESLDECVKYVLSIDSTNYKEIVAATQNRLYSYNSVDNFYNKFKEVLFNEKNNN